jgi:hypothetical protein
MKRFITGLKNGKNVILESDEVQLKSMMGAEAYLLWKTEGIPSVPAGEEILKNKQGINFPDSPGNTSFAVNILEPDTVVLEKTKKMGIDAKKIWREFFHDELGMHTTNTVDYDLIISKEIWMEVDDGVEVHLRAGDCVIQNGTRHAWRNKSKNNCVMATVMIGANRKKS